MVLQLYKLNLTHVHFGDASLERSTIQFAADSLFSALCIEALKAGGIQLLSRLHTSVNTGTLRFTDALPYMSDTYLLPKPLVQVRTSDRAHNASNSIQKKLAKRINYVPVDALEEFVIGISDLAGIAAVQGGLGKAGTAERVAIHNGKEETDPYRVGFFSFASEAGLWVLVTGTDEEVELFRSLLEQLAHAGIGGERTSGYGRFTLTQTSVPTRMTDRFSVNESGPLLSLSVSLPDDSEFESSLVGAQYRLIKRSGFVASTSFASTPRRKRDIYKFAAGSVFCRPFDGVIADVADGGNHPVYSYAKPVFYPLKGILV